MKVQRESLLRALELVSPGLAPREVVEQSSCFLFQGGKISSYNDEIGISLPSGLDGEIKGAVGAKKLLEMLRKLKEEEISLSVKDGKLLVRGKNKISSFLLEAQINPDLNVGEDPEKWISLPEDFLTAIGMVQECAGKEESETTRYVHIHPKFVEAMDGFQACRYKLKTGFSSPALVRRESIKHIVQSGVVEVGETDNWIHFRSGEGLVFSCRRFVDDYKDLSPHFQVEGESIVLPKGLSEAAARAEIASSENLDQNFVLVELSPGLLKVRGLGITCQYREDKKVQYKGKPLRFLIKPSLLSQLVQKYNECIISGRAIRVSGERWVYVTALGVPEEIKS